MIGIAAADKMGGIGFNNSLPWPKISEDLKFFKSITLNKSIIVGNNTFKHLPNLKDRYFKVLTNNQELLKQQKFDNGEYFSLNDFDVIDDFVNWTHSDVLCGGSQVYKELIPFCDEFYLTCVNGIYKCDTYLPYYSNFMNNSLFINKEIVKDLGDGSIIYKFSNILQEELFNEPPF